ncbi:M15 family metallopeptidase [Epibacterium ulvae]|uniref:M15 family metallopeptidase n=1 Tax=Epibacterium ulvae TaxID=1156985 RepID=UPI002492B0B3|nr:M15 family metallopeptidase [Epibacterium ulvae]
MQTTTEQPLDWNAARLIKAGTSEEPLVPVTGNQSWITHPAYYESGIKYALPDIWVREGVYNRLLHAARALENGYQLVLLDGWRPKPLQQYLFDHIRAAVAARNPGLSSGEIDELTLNFAARASDDAISPSPHLTGGAIDVTLADQDGHLLDMGSKFDEPSDKSWTFAKVTSTQAKHRRALLAAMQSAGFTNLPTEWWHFDFGNWIWALYSKETTALYGPTSL